MLQGRDEGAVAAQLLVPPAVQGGKLGADRHLVDGRVQLQPGIAAGKGARVIGEAAGEIRVLEIAQPVGQAKMAEVDDGDQIAPLQVQQGVVGKRPVVAAVAQPGAVDGRPVAQHPHAQLLDQVEGEPPVTVMAALLQLIDAGLAVMNGGIAVLDPGGKHEAREQARLRKCCMREASLASERARTPAAHAKVYRRSWWSGMFKMRRVSSTGTRLASMKVMAAERPNARRSAWAW